MRATPTFAIVGTPGYSNASGATLAGYAYAIVLNATATGTGGTAVTCNYTASADL